MTYNKPLIAVFFGALSLIPYEIVTQIAKYLGWTTHSAFELNSMMFIEKGSWILGALSASATGGLAGLVTYELIRFAGSDYLPVKGGLVGMFTWAIIDVTFGTLGKITTIDQPLSGHFVHAFGAGFAGLIWGYLIQRYLTKRYYVVTKVKK